MKGVALTATRGGVGKSSLGHALALGAAWNHVPAYFMHTDNRPPIEVHGRPYAYYDARDPKTLVTLIDAAMNSDGLTIIDSGGNRPDFDKWIAESVDLVLIPVTPDPDSVSEGLAHLARLETAGAKNVRFIINIYPSGQTERDYVDRTFFAKLPAEKIMGRVGKVEAIRTLRIADTKEQPFQTPPSRLNNFARALYHQVQELL